MPFLVDELLETGGANVNLQSHTADTGGPWTRHPLFGTNTTVQGSSAGYAVCASPGNASMYYAPAGAGDTQTITADLYCILATDSSRAGCVVRCDTSTDDAYWVRIRPSTNLLEVHRRDAGATVLLATASVTVPLNAAATLVVTVETVGSTVEVSVTYNGSNPTLTDEGATNVDVSANKVIDSSTSRKTGGRCGLVTATANQRYLRVEVADASVVVNADAASAIDWQSAAVADATLYADWLGSPLADAAIPTEWQGTVRIDGAVPEDWVRLTQRDAAIAITWLRALARDGLAPIEWGGSVTAIAGDGAAPIEWLAARIADGTIPIDGLAQRLIDALLHTEWGGAAANVLPQRVWHLAPRPPFAHMPRRSFTWHLPPRRTSH